MTMKGTLLLTRKEVAALLSLDECIAVVEQAFRRHGEGKVTPPAVLGMHVSGGGFHIKAALLDQGRSYFAAKLNGNFFENRARFGLPNIQGVIALCDAENGYPLALMDSIEITMLRTGAATALAAQYLARCDSEVVTICGCGNQGYVQLAALTRVLSVRRVFAFDLDPVRSGQFARDASDWFLLQAEAIGDLRSAVEASDVVVTCTPSMRFFLERQFVRPGTFIAAVGADNPQKQELEPSLLAGNKTVVDILEQCAAFGDLHHALEQGLVTTTDVYAELGELAAGRRPGRTSQSEITIFDSTGTALQDAAASVRAYENAQRRGLGTVLNFAA